MFNNGIECLQINIINLCSMLMISIQKRGVEVYEPNFNTNNKTLGLFPHHPLLFCQTMRLHYMLLEV